MVTKIQRTANSEQRTALKRWSKIMLLCFFSVTFWHCQKEEININVENKKSSTPSVKKISFDEFKKNSVAYRKFKNSKELLKQNVDSKLVIDSTNNFYYNTNNINRVEFGDYHSYIIPVYRKNESESLENLFIHLKNNGEYAAFLINYDLTELDKVNLKNNLPISNLVEKTSYTLLENFDYGNLENTNQRSGCGNHGYSGFWIVNGVCCYVIDRVISATLVTVVYCGTPQELGLTVPNYSPPEDPSGGSGSGSVNFTVISSAGNPGGEPVSNPFGNSGGGSGSNNEIIIVNTPILIDEKIVELDKITTRVTNIVNPFRDKIDEYVNNINNYQVETGVEFRFVGINTYQEVNTVIANGFDYIIFSYPTDNTYLHIHVHHNYSYTDSDENEFGLAPIPSGGDLIGFAVNHDSFSNAQLAKDYKSIVVTTNGLYAIVVKDQQKLGAFYDKYNTPKKQKEFERKFNDEVVKEAMIRASTKFNNTPGATQADLEVWIKHELMKLLIDFLKDLDAGIDIYKGEIDNLTNNYYWYKLTN